MTVEELKDRMSLAEFTGWLSFERECGPLNPYLRFEAAIARAVAPFLKGPNVRDYLMPWPKEPEADPDDPSQVIAFLKATFGAKEKQ